MDLVLGTIAVVVWLLVMVPAAFVFFDSSDPTAASEMVLDNVTHLSRNENREDDDAIAA